MKYIYVTIATILFTTIISFAQTATIQGNVQVNNSTDHSGITVHITVDIYDNTTPVSFDDDVTTDANGNYTYSFTLNENPLYTSYGIGNPYFDGVLTITFSKSTYTSDFLSGISVNTTPVTIDNMLLFPVGITVYQPTICMVRYDTTTNIPNIVWERETGNDIKSYIISKLINQTWTNIDTVLFADLSVFEDFDAEPTISYDYQIQAIFNDDSRSRYSEAKAAPRIEVQTIGGTPKITWLNLSEITRIDPNVVTKVILFRSPTQHNWIPIDSVEIEGITVDSLISLSAPFQDNNIPAEGVYNYRIGHKYISPCSPAILKTESGPFILAMSNIAESENVPTSIINIINQAPRLGIQISDNMVTINALPKTLFEILTIDGKSLAKGNLNTPINVSLSKGVYVISYSVENKKGTQKFIVE